MDDDNTRRGPTKLYNTAEVARLLGLTNSQAHYKYHGGHLGEPAYFYGRGDYPLWTAFQVAELRRAAGIDDE